LRPAWRPVGCTCSIGAAARVAQSGRARLRRFAKLDRQAGSSSRTRRIAGLDMAAGKCHDPQAMSFMLRFFTWWNGQTFGTQVWTSLYGELVGEDEFGNRYFRTRGGKIDPGLGFERRWVIYNGVAEASSIPPSWHGWLHHTVDIPPTEDKVVPRPWWKPHRPNLTGTPGAHRPTGSTLAQGRRPKATGDYKAWSPGR